MGLLSAPILATTIPAFCSTNRGIELSIPFTMSRAVSPSQVKGFSIKIKTIQSGIVVGTYQIDNTNKVDNYFVANLETVLNQQQLDVIISNTNLSIGQFYKFQIAYIDKENNIGNYSAVAVGKYTSLPKVSINNLTQSNLNSHLYTYEGLYEQDKDETERVYNYQFDLYDSNGDLISTSGELLHNSNEDDRNSKITRDIYTFAQDLKFGDTFKIVYTVKTINGLVVSSPRYRITQQKSINSELKATINTALNYNNGYIDIGIISDNNELVSGSFILARSSSVTNYTVWDEIYRFQLIAQVPTQHLFKDFTIQQGEYYRYSIQQYSDLLVSNRILSDIIYADFEDAFLYDGKRQLKIKYNPKISSFKKDLLETKTDTIGGKHPFIFRNGRVYYSEFPISGLISYQMDEENLFLSEKDYGLTEKTVNLTSENIAAERVFKMKVLEWLTNGEPKVFRSPSEGNFIVRLMNSSLSPNDTVGRMLHTFSCTAYEIADYNYSTFSEMGFIKIKALNNYSLQWETLLLKDIEDINENLLAYPATTLRFDDMTPGDIISIRFMNEVYPELIKIGVTGSYYLDVGMEIAEAKILNSSLGTLTYSYYFNKKPRFETVLSINVEEIPGRQFVGEHDILKEILYIQDPDETEKEVWIQNPKLELVDIYTISVEKRPLQKLQDLENNNEQNTVSDAFFMYDVGTLTEEEGPRPGYPKIEFEHAYYYDAYNRTEHEIYNPEIILNGNSISVNEKEYLNFKRPGTPKEFKSYNGCLTAISYAVCNIKYNLEEDARTASSSTHPLYKLNQAIQKYDTATTQLKNYLKQLDTSTETDAQIAANVQQYRQNVQTTYARYIKELIKAQEADDIKRGVTT